MMILSFVFRVWGREGLKMQRAHSCPEIARNTRGMQGKPGALGAPLAVLPGSWMSKFWTAMWAHIVVL